MAQLILTRFLYNKDEVELSLITALLKNEDIQIIYYWLYELYYSGFDAFELLWKIYLDFYYEQQPYFVTYFKKKHSLWKQDGSMVHIAYIARNMHLFKSSCMVFMMRQYMDKADATFPTIMYKFKGVIPDWLHSYDKQYHSLLLALERRHYENICYYLKKLDIQEMSAVVLQFLQCEIDYKDINSMHYLLAFIVENKKNATGKDAWKKHLYVAPKQEHLDHILAIETEQIPLSKHGLPQIYNTLMYKRYTCIDEYIGSFELARFKWSTYEEFINELYFHWEYYAMGSPLWFKRLQTFGGSINQQEKNIEFLTENEEGKEGFYTLYAYELDELPKEVQEMSMKQLCNTDGKSWYNYIFQEDYGLENYGLENYGLENLTIDDNERHIWQWIY